MSEEEFGTGAADKIYKWTIRSLYTVAIAINVYLMVSSYEATESGKELRAKFEQRKQAFVRPWKERKHFRRDVAETIVEAWVIVDDAKKAQEEK
jgi:hypothetical protein